jgi:hypothetical protein
MSIENYILKNGPQIIYFLKRQPHSYSSKFYKRILFMVL